ncbi:MAG: class I SAM-dependent methyltransferase, partial [Leptospiraceae bacterium]|nr:class I SAM-dependent methyltransferase [Leptospiraceae bacterium]
MIWKLANRLLETDRLPDFVIRRGIRHLNKLRLKTENQGSEERNQENFMRLVEFLKSSPIAVQTDKANEQHYEVPAEFYALALGKHKKYSSCFYPKGDESLDEAEEIMLQKTVERAELKDGMQILELGCGWGSLTLFMAERFPRAKITAISNSSSQRKFIEKTAKDRNLKNIKIITKDMNKFQVSGKFDRIVSVEMFEHMRNYELMFQKISSVLKPNGKMFVHIFTHKSFAYLF